MTSPYQFLQAATPTLSNERAGVWAGGVDQRILRIERIGKRLFDVANCIVTLGAAPLKSPAVGRSMAAMEMAFCHGMPLPAEPIVMPDVRNDAGLCRHQSVVGAPYIRFYAAHPVYSQDGELIGKVSLINYVPRLMSEGDRQMLADLAILVEHELQLGSMGEAQFELERTNKSLRRKSLIDPLIGTWNRGAIMRILTIDAIRCEKSGVPLSLIVIDLDHFKKINDAHGHPAGDEVLVRVASRLRSCIRPQEALGRYGGEEFLIVLPGSSGATAAAVAERMRQAIAAESESIGGTTISVSISAGVASTDVFPKATAEELIDRADTAMYAAKEAGRNRVVRALPDVPSPDSLS
jgi:diguanylate cyclase (GGDEF)-like protein